MPAWIATFTFLRPAWLLALLAVPLLLWWRWRRAGEREGWQRAVDAHLLPHLLQRHGGRRAHGAWWLAGLGAALAIVALAGPSWRQQIVPLWQVQSPLVIALDLSSAMNAADLPPSRLVQARARIEALLRQRQGGQVGLLAFAGDAFNVAPITDDANTVGAMLETLDPELMPVDGQRVDRGIARAVAQLKGAGFARGEILVLTDHADAAANEAAAAARTAGFVVHVLGVGTPGGAPLTGRRGFVTNANGEVQLARLDAASLRTLAEAGGGRYATMSGQGADLAALGLLDPQGEAAEVTGSGGGTDQARVQRSDDGCWLVLLLLPLALFAFRRGWLAMLPLAMLFGSAAAPEPVLAADPPAAARAEPPAVPDSWWDSLWQRDDQRARHALDRGDVATAQALARDPALQGTAAYRGEAFAQAAQAWQAQDSADAHYNRGNALAMAGHYPEAIAAYDEALAREPGMPDAVANRQAVADLMKQQQEQQQQPGDSQNGDQQQGDQQQSGNPQQGDQQQGDQQQGDQQQGDQQQGDQQQGDQQQGDQQQGDQQQADQQQAGDSQQGDQQQSDDSQQSDDAQQGNDKENAPGDAQRQQQADEAARKAMEQALAQQQGADPNGQPQQGQVPSEEERAEQEQRQAMEQWLRRVPDDPGGLLRRKFALEYQRRQAEESRR